MKKIKVLDEITINKIAAGEVIENPASVVKELIENSIDAESTQICVEIKAGGRQLIRITDNGTGMSEEDALLALERHATSKIRSVDDIESLLTMGFRGEAIPSIASISKFSIITALKSDEKQNHATYVRVEGGRILCCNRVARSPGTTMEVEQLFYNVPVRRKFQRSPTYDVQEIHKIITQIALINPHIQFQLISDEKNLLLCQQCHQATSMERLCERAQQLFGNEVIKSTHRLITEHHQYHAEGLIGSVDYHKPNRSGQFLFVNRRCVQSTLISNAMKLGYGTMLQQQKYPFFILNLTLPGHLVDVNVHPQKREVRLRQESVIKEWLIQAVQGALKRQFFSAVADEDFPFKEDDWTHVPVSFSKDSLERVSAYSEKQPFEYVTLEEKFQIQNSNEIEKIKGFSEETSSLFSLKPSDNHLKIGISSEIIKEVKVPSVLATIQNFILLEPSSLTAFGELSCEEGLWMIDQKSAYFRIIYESLLEKELSEHRSLMVQPLLIPFSIDFNPIEAEKVRSCLVLFHKLGLLIEPAGQSLFMINALPYYLEKESVAAFISSVLEEITDGPGDRISSEVETVKRELEKRVAHKVSRQLQSLNRRLTIQEAQSLLEQLMKCSQTRLCPFGKPILVHLSSEQLLKQFNQKR